MRSLVAALGLLSCSYVSAFGASHFVKWDGTGDFPTIQAAVDAAAEGDTVLLSVALGWFVSPWWFLLTAFVGLNLLQSGFTRWCPMMAILRKVGVRRTRSS